MLIGLPYNQIVGYQVPSRVPKGLKRDKLVSAGIFFVGQLFFTDCLAIGAFGETGDNDKIDK